MMAVRIETEPRFSPGKPRLLFEVPYADAGVYSPNFDISPDGSRFIMIQSKLETATDRLIVVHNWFEELKQRVPVAGR